MNGIERATLAVVVFAAFLSALINISQRDDMNAMERRIAILEARAQ